MDILTPKLSTPHRSTPDWHLSPGWTLDYTEFVSPPASLSALPGLSCNAILLHPDAHDIPEGYIFFAIYPTHQGWTEVAFRIGLPDALWPALASYYYLDIFHSNFYGPGFDGVNLYRYDAGSTLLASWVHNPTPAEWNFYYLTFFSICNLPLPKAIHVELTYLPFLPGELIGAHTDPLNLWHDRGVNRVGCAISSQPDMSAHNLDDFILWQFVQPPYPA